MKNEKSAAQAQYARTARSIASTAAAIALLLFAATRFAYANIIWDPGYYGEFGINANPWTDFSVRRIVPGSPADEAGVKIGDKIERPKTLHQRLVLSRIAPHPGEQITLTVLQGDQRRTVTLQARPLAPLSLTDRILLAVDFSWLIVFVAVSFVLVLLRPSITTWGFFLFPLNLTIIFSPSDLFFSYIPTSSFLALRVVEDLIAPAGIVGFLIFGLRFPTIAPTGWRRTVEILAPFLFVAIAVPLAYWDFVNIVIRPVATLPFALDAGAVAIFVAGAVAVSTQYVRATDLDRRSIVWVIFALLVGIVAAAVGLRKQFFETGPEQHWTAHAALMLSTVALLITYFGARGLERQRIKWVVLGVICAWVADGANHLGLSLASSYNPKWFIGMLEVLYVALPLALAYAVLRYRVIDVRFALSRSLAVGAVAAIVALIVIGIDWLFSTTIPHSRLEAVAYVGVALIVGFSLNAAWLKLGKTIDFVFFHPWYRTQEQAGSIADTIRRATSKVDLYEPLSTEIARAFSLASVALFERVEDAGFARVAARGWSDGTIWHLLSDDPPVLRAFKGPSVVDLDTVPWNERDLPNGVARPTVMLPMVAEKRVLAVLLCGAHDNGTGLAPDEIRSIRRLCADAVPVFAGSLAGEADRRAFTNQRVAPI